MYQANHHNNQSSQYDHQHHYIPIKTFLTMPNTQDDYYVGEGKSIRRFLFEGNANKTYTNFQKQKYKQLIDYWQQNKSKIPANIVNNNFWNQSWKMRWLTSQKFHAKNAIKAMQIHTNYLQTNRSKVPPEIQKVLKKGIFYVSGRDAYMRPILVFDIDKMIKMEITQNQLLESQKFFFQFVLNQLLLSGQTETWIAIIDVGYQNLTSLISPLKSSIGFLSNTFRNRMRIAYVVRVPGSISFLWSIIKRFLEEDTAQKINFLDQQSVAPLLKYTNPSQLQVKYGGTQAQITQFWPSRTVKRLQQLNLLEFSHPDVPNKIISPQQYRSKFQKGDLLGHKISKLLLKDQKKQKQQQQKRKLQHQKLQQLKIKQSGTLKIHQSPRNTTTSSWNNQMSKFNWPVEYKPLKAPELKIQECICWEKLIK